jgi:Na+/glutamate symporter
VLEAMWGLLVEDGSLAVGIVVALAATWIAAVALPERAVDQVGWLLLALLVALMLFNLRAAAYRALRETAPLR